jgi:hypothetical protein
MARSILGVKLVGIMLDGRRLELRSDLTNEFAAIISREFLPWLDRFASILPKLYHVLRSAQCCSEYLVNRMIGGNSIPPSLGIPLWTWRSEIARHTPSPADGCWTNG